MAPPGVAVAVCRRCRRPTHEGATPLHSYRSNRHRGYQFTRNCRATPFPGTYGIIGAVGRPGSAFRQVGTVPLHGDRGSDRTANNRTYTASDVTCQRRVAPVHFPAHSRRSTGPDWNPKSAAMAELADALGSGPSERKLVEVRLLLAAFAPLFRIYSGRPTSGQGMVHLPACLPRPFAHTPYFR